jgi:hypothetical protein
VIQLPKVARIFFFKIFFFRCGKYIGGCRGIRLIGDYHLVCKGCFGARSVHAFCCSLVLVFQTPSRTWFGGLSLRPWVRVFMCTNRKVLLDDLCIQRVKSLKQRSRIGAMEDPTQGSLQAHHAHCIQQLVLEKKLYALKTH